MYYIISRYREKLKVHAMRVMAVVEKTIHRLDDEVRAGKILVVYGQRHCNFGVTVEMMYKMGQSFVRAIQPYFERTGDWDSAQQDAWQALFKFIIFCITIGFGDQGVMYYHQRELNRNNPQQPDDPLPSSQAAAAAVAENAAISLQSIEELPIDPKDVVRVIRNQIDESNPNF